MARPRIIYIMGPPGAGKGTQAELLCRSIGYFRFSTGDAFREVAAEDSPLGRSVREKIDNGFLAPPEMAAEIVMKAVQKHLDAGEGVVFDGTPRTVEEAAIIDDFFVRKNYGHPFAVYVRVDQEEMARRNSIRKFCLGIQGGFAVMNESDTQRCEEKGGTVGRRPDDEPEKFAARWQEFMTRTYPVAQRYLREGWAKEIDGERPVAEVQADIVQLIESL